MMKVKILVDMYEGAPKGAIVEARKGTGPNKGYEIQATYDDGPPAWLHLGEHDVEVLYEAKEQAVMNNVHIEPGVKVKITATIGRIGELGIGDRLFTSAIGTYVDNSRGHKNPHLINMGTNDEPDSWFFAECDFELVKEYETASEAIARKEQAVMRTFDSGATRHTDVDKFDYEGFLSPLVLERYAQYLHKHRTQADGKLRDSDNWQKGIPRDTYMKSAWRHLMAWWRKHRGHETQEEIEDDICAVMFNTMGYLHELLKEKTDEKETDIRQS